MAGGGGGGGGGRSARGAIVTIHSPARMLMTFPTQHTLRSLSIPLPLFSFLPFRNIVATVNLHQRLERAGLKQIAMKCRNTEYNPKRFAAVIMRLREPKTTALIFGTGKIVVTGARNPDMSKRAAKKYVQVVNKVGFNAQFKDFKVQNVVASCDVKFPIRLEGLSIGEHSDFSTYEPELFPGLIYRMMTPKVVLLIFVSGKVVLTGAKTPSQIYEAFDNIYDILKKYKKA